MQSHQDAIKLDCSKGKTRLLCSLDRGTPILTITNTHKYQYSWTLRDLAVTKARPGSFAAAAKVKQNKEHQNKNTLSLGFGQTFVSLLVFLPTNVQ